MTLGKPEWARRRSFVSSFLTPGRADTPGLVDVRVDENYCCAYCKMFKSFVPFLEAIGYVYTPANRRYFR